MSDLMLDVDQAGELKAAFRRGEWTNALIKRLCEGEILSKVRLVLEDKAEIVMKKVEQKIVLPLLGLIKSITHGAVAGKKTADCFTNKSRYYYRNSDLDSWLPKIQPDQAESNFAVKQLTRPATFMEVVSEFLGVQGDVATLAAVLKEKGVVTTLPVIEALIERQENGEDVGLRTEGYANFFFVENKDGEVSVVLVHRDDGRWGVDVGRLGSGGRWSAGRRFFFRNVDAVTL
jgi:hypothetical protein